MKDSKHRLPGRIVSGELFASMRTFKKQLEKIENQAKQQLEFSFTDSVTASLQAAETDDIYIYIWPCLSSICETKPCLHCTRKSSWTFTQYPPVLQSQVVDSCLHTTYVGTFILEFTFLGTLISLAALIGSSSQLSDVISRVVQPL